MSNIKKDLQAVNKDLRELAKKIDKMVVAVDKLEKSKPAKTKPVKKAAAKKEKKLTAPETVLAIINRRKRGVDTATLKKRTGFQDQKLYNVVYTLKKQKKIKNAGKGIYVKVL